MKTQGEIEAAVCEGISRFELEYMGRGPKDIHTHLIGDLLVIRLHGVLTSAEQQLVKTLPLECAASCPGRSRPRTGGFVGSIDIGGWHAPVYRGDLEMTG
jgi:hypothetical protein